MNRTQMYVALCAVAVGKKIISVGKPIPSDASEAKITAWLGNGSIKESEGDDQIYFNNGGNGDDENNNDQGLFAGATNTDSNLSADVSSSVIENATSTVEANAGAASENVIEGNQSESQTATLVGGITKDGRLVALQDWTVPELKKLATDLEVANAKKLNKEALIEAITAIEFAADQLEP